MKLLIKHRVPPDCRETQRSLSDPCPYQAGRQGELCSQGCGVEADLQSHLHAAGLGRAWLCFAGCEHLSHKVLTGSVRTGSATGDAEVPAAGAALGLQPAHGDAEQRP